jgi:hypothetical protein
MENKMHNTYSLSIRFASDGFSLSVYDQNKVVISRKQINENFFEMSDTKIVDTLADITELQQNFASARIIVNSYKYCVIPAQLFDTPSAIKYFEFQFGKTSANEQILFNALPVASAVIVFSVPAMLYNALHPILPEINIEHHLSHVFNDFVKLNDKIMLQLWLNKNSFDALLINKGQLMLANHFDYETKDDFVYHAANILKEFGGDKSNAEIMIYSKDNCDELAALCNKHLAVCGSRIVE